jgi:hypothetical protein
MATGSRKRRALQELVKLRSKLEEVALREEVREEFEALDKQGVPLPQQPEPATPTEIDARTIEKFNGLVPTELLETLVDDRPPMSGTRTARALGRMDVIVGRAKEHSRRTRGGLANTLEEDTRRKLPRELVAALAKIKLPTGSRNKSKDAEAYLKANHPRLWRDGWLTLSTSRRREIMIASQKSTSAKAVK